jgi:hypothetical protein
MRKAWELIDEFVVEHGIPSNRYKKETYSLEELECPRFVPCRHLMLVSNLRHMLSQVELLPAIVARKDAAIQDCRSISHIFAPAFAAVHPTRSPRAEYPILFTDRALIPQHAVYQAVCSEYLLTIGGITDGPVTLLRQDSIRDVKILNSIAKASIAALCSASQVAAEENPCGCNTHRRRRSDTYSCTLLSDVVVDIDRSAVSSYVPSDSGLSLFAEIYRTIEVTNCWVAWFNSK